MNLRIGIIGTRGIPNNYGGFECFAEHLSQGLVKKGHQVYVYNSHNHPNQQSEWNDVNIIHCFDPEYRLGSFGQFIYDLNCIRDARKRNFDLLLFLGYTSSSVWGKLYPKNCVVISNMDGLEWKRTKYSAATRRFLLYAEKLAVRYSHYLVADSVYIQDYIQNKYDIRPRFIAYGSDLYKDSNEDILAQYQLQSRKYNMIMARMEPENNIEMVLEGFRASQSQDSLIVVGATSNRFGKYLVKKFSADSRIRFLGSIFNPYHINNLISFSNLYFHGHSVGGTNPSLLEAMGSRALIVAQDNVFNRSVLKKNAHYFTCPQDVTRYANTLQRSELHEDMIEANAAAIANHYSWDQIIDQYEKYFLQCWLDRHPLKKPQAAAILQPEE